MCKTLYMSCLEGYAFKQNVRHVCECPVTWLHLTHIAVLLSKVEITSTNLLEVVSVYAHIIAVRCYLGVLGRLGRGCSSGQNGEKHQKL